MSTAAILAIFAAAIALAFAVAYRVERTRRTLAERIARLQLGDSSWHSRTRQDITRQPYRVRTEHLPEAPPITNPFYGPTIHVIDGPGLQVGPDGWNAGPATMDRCLDLAACQNIRDLMNLAYREGAKARNL